MHSRLLIVVLLAALAAVGCSAPQLAYRNADWLITRYATDMLDLDRVQRADWQPVLREALAVHRERDLPRIVDLLQRAQTAARSSLDQGTVACLVEEGDELVRSAAELVVQVGVPVLMALRPEQVQHLRQRFDEREVEYRARYLAADPGQRQQRRGERVLERVERWTGRLDDSQRQRVMAEVVNWPDTSHDWYVYRGQQQQQLLALLEAPRDADALGAFLRRWWVELGGRPATLANAQREVLGGAVAMVLRLDAQLAPAQREELAGNVDGLRASLAGLTATEITAASQAGECTGSARRRA